MKGMEYWSIGCTCIVQRATLVNMLEGHPDDKGKLRPKIDLASLRPLPQISFQPLTSQYSGGAIEGRPNIETNRRTAIGERRK